MNLRTLISSIFSKTKSDINNEKRQRVIADENLQNEISSFGNTIPTKTSDLTNDSDFVDSSYHDSSKQDILTAGDNITIENNVISATGGSSTELYEHRIYIRKNYSDSMFLFFKFITNSNTPITLQTLGSILYNMGAISVDTGVGVTNLNGFEGGSNTKYVGCVYGNQNGQLYYAYANSLNVSFLTTATFPSTVNNFVDTIRQIL